MKIVKSIVIAILIHLFLFQSLNAQTFTQTVTLKEGFNFVSFTVVPSVTAQQLIQQYQTIEDIYLYSSSAGSFLSVGSGELVTLNPGKGYIIKAKYSDIININGTDILNIGNIIELLDGVDPEIVSGQSLFIKLSEEAARNYDSDRVAIDGITSSIKMR